MAIPYDTPRGTSVRNALDKHLRIKHNGTLEYVEDIQIKTQEHGEILKEVYIKNGGSWRLVHEGDILFNVTLNSSGQND